MDIVCPSCNKSVGKVEAVARLILTVHCPFDGCDFGVAVDPPPQPVQLPLEQESSAPPVA